LEGGLTDVTKTQTAVAPALEVIGLSKTFGNQRVLADVSLAVESGTIRGLVGANGSGKSTLIKILAGYHAADPGSALRVGGVPLATHHAAESERAGLRFVHQDLALVGDQSTVENLGLGQGYGSRRARPINWRSRRRLAIDALQGLGYDIDVEIPVGNLSPSEQTAVAVARALSEHAGVPRLLVLDEPTATLPGAEAQRLLALVRRLKSDGIAVLFVSHHLPEIFDLCDAVTVLRDGAVVTTRPTGELTEDVLIELMVGRSVSTTRFSSAAPSDRGVAVLTVAGLSGTAVHDVDLAVHAGEIVGVAGVTGSGREQIAPLIFGAQPRKGIVAVAGTSVRGGRPAESVGAGVGLVPGDRAKNAALHGHDVCENIAIARPRDFVRYGLLRRSLAVAMTEKWLDELDVRPRRPNAAIGELSGGNAQKVMVARWLRLRPKVLILDEPTQGVDARAREDIYAVVAELAAAGCAVVVCSSDSTELARICNRVLVLVRGSVATEFRAPMDADEITGACLATTIGKAA
jgi:ribose transport system ATP-binding protein